MLSKFTVHIIHIWERTKKNKQPAAKKKKKKDQLVNFLFFLRIVLKKNLREEGLPKTEVPFFNLCSDLKRIAIAP